MDTIGIGIIGSQFISTIHADSIQRHTKGGRLIAAASPTREHIEEFGKQFNIPNTFTDYKQLLDMPEIDLVIIGVPNHLHCQITCDAASAGKHIVMEKPLCLNLDEADKMIATCKSNNVKLMYAEELCFTPKYVRLKKLLDEGAVGDLIMVKQSEKHDGPHADHFWDVQRSGGGVMMDMGCHAIEFFRWMVGRDVPVTEVYADMGTYVHHDKTQGDDNSLLILTFANGVKAVAEESWIKKGGMDDRAEILGSQGIAYADVLHGNSILTYSEQGYGYAVEKAGNTKGWTFTIYEEAWNYGFPQEMQHFIDCVRYNQTPAVTGEDGRAVLEIICAAYESAATKAAVKLPFTGKPKIPIQPWLERTANTNK